MHNTSPFSWTANQNLNAEQTHRLAASQDHGLLSTLKVMLHMLGLSAEARNNRHAFMELSMLNDRELADIGLNRSDLYDIRAGRFVAR